MDRRLQYEAITKRNSEALRRLQELQSKNAWAKYPPIRPRDLCASLINDFRCGVWHESQGKLEPSEWQRMVQQAISSALSTAPDEKAARAIENAIYGARRSHGLLDPARRQRREPTAPDPELSAAEHTEIERILKSWLLDVLKEFS